MRCISNLIAPVIHGWLPDDIQRTQASAILSVAAGSIFGLSCLALNSQVSEHICLLYGLPTAKLLFLTLMERIPIKAQFCIEALLALAFGDHDLLRSKIPAEKDAKETQVGAEQRPSYLCHLAKCLWAGGDSINSPTKKMDEDSAEINPTFVLCGALQLMVHLPATKESFEFKMLRKLAG